MGTYKYFINIGLILISYIFMNSNHLTRYKFKDNEINIINNISLIKAIGGPPSSYTGRSLTSISSSSGSDQESLKSDIESRNNEASNEKRKESKLKKFLGKSSSMPNLTSKQKEGKGFGDKFRKLLGLKRKQGEDKKGEQSNKKDTEGEGGEGEGGEGEGGEGEEEKEVEEIEKEQKETKDFRYPPISSLFSSSPETQTNYNDYVMTLYLETQVTSTQAQIQKAEDILVNNRQSFKTLKRSFLDMTENEECTEGMLDTIFLLSLQVHIAKGYCEISSSKISNEVGYCKNRCKVLSSKSCRACKAAFKKQQQCSSIINKIKSMLKTLYKILKTCLIKRELFKLENRRYVLHNGITTFKCSEQQYKRLKGELELELFLAAIIVTYLNNLNKLKEICSQCIREECYNCKSVAYCTSCPGLEDISACSNCQAVQSLMSTFIIDRNKHLMESRRITHKLQSCENYLASKSGDYITAEKKSDVELGKQIEESINLLLVKYNPGYLENPHSHHQNTEGFEEIKSKYKTFKKTIPDDLRHAINSGVKLKSSKPRPKVLPKPAGYPETIIKLKSRDKPIDQERSESSTKYKIPKKVPMISTSKEREIALKLFENGVCTHLMLSLLESELSECNRQISELSNIHSQCEICVSDGCRRGNCSNLAELRKLVKKREEVSEQINRCNRMGFLSSSELKAKMEEVKSKIKDEKETSTTSTKIQVSKKAYGDNESATEDEEGGGIDTHL